jgi:hypothetical protein
MACCADFYNLYIFRTITYCYHFCTLLVMIYSFLFALVRSSLFLILILSRLNVFCVGIFLGGVSKVEDQWSGHI